MASRATSEIFETGVEIGGLSLALRSGSPDFIRMLEGRYANFLCLPARRAQAGPLGEAAGQIDVTVVPSERITDEKGLDVRQVAGRWVMRRGDFLAEWDPATRRGRVHQSPHPYSIDSVLRIVLSLVLAETDGFLLHSASAIRNGRAFLFSGVSGAGKTTIARLAPPDVTILTDEISYVRRLGAAYHAFGTPFAGELETAGENVAAPIAGVYFLAKGRENRVSPMSEAAAARALLRNVLFFADDGDLVQRLFRFACEFVSNVPVYELTFRPEAAVWELIA